MTNKLHPAVSGDGILRSRSEKKETPIRRGPRIGPQSLYGLIVLILIQPATWLSVGLAILAAIVWVVYNS
jgi:hypothetical protein